MGTLTTGDADCVNSVNDYYTKFDYAWDYYDAPSKQLQHWLDPAGTGTITLNGLDPLAVAGTAPPEELRFRIYPNPADGLLHVDSDLPGRGITEISVYHISGTLLIQSLSTQTGKHALDVSQLAPGIYILSLRKEKHMANQRFIIAR